MSQTKNKLGDLRNHLFETLELLKDSENPMDTQRARAIADVAHAIINSCKVELRAAELLGIDPGLVDGPALTAGQHRPPVPQLVAGSSDDTFCEPCFDRKNLKVPMTRMVDGTRMCKSCLAS